MTRSGDGERHPERRVVVPPSLPRERWRRLRRRILLAVLALGMLAVLVWAVSSRLEDAWQDAVPGVGGPRPAAGPADSTTGAAGAGRVGTEPADSAVVVFRSRMRDVEQAASSYFQRRRDFDRGRLDCEGLARGYAEVDDANTSLVLAQAAVRDRLTESDLEAYRELTAEVRSVDADFDRSGCPRPR